MKKIISVLLSSSVIASAATAEHSFNGFKAGLNLGAGFTAGRAHLNYLDTLTLATDSVSANKSERNLVLGAQLAWDKVLSNNMLFGVEGILDYHPSKGKIFDPGTTGNNLSLNVGSEYTVGIMGRVGYAFDKSVVYAGLGWVATDWNVKSSFDSRANGGTLDSFKKHKFISGIRFSGAIGTEICNRTFATLEGSYTIYKSLKTSNNFVALGNASTLTAKYKPEVLDVKLKLSYKI